MKISRFSEGGKEMIQIHSAYRKVTTCNDINKLKIGGWKKTRHGNTYQKKGEMTK